MGDEAVRDVKGRFKPGYSGGPGRPKKEVEAEYLRVLSEKLSPEMLGQVLEDLLSENSWRSKAFAVELALHYGLGKPVQRVVTSGNGLADIVEALKSLN